MTDKPVYKNEFDYKIPCSSGDATELRFYGSVNYVFKNDNPAHRTDTLWFTYGNAYYLDEEKVDELIVALMYWKSLKDMEE